MKRVLDLAVAGTALLLLAPVLLILTVIIRYNMGPPAMFRQIRPGRDGLPFEMLKFRTMREASAADGQPLPDHMRLTRLGLFLRATSLDELPELWNVLKGDMSLVGPRPLLMEYLPRYNVEQARRHAVLPGLTGWAQINGRNALSWEEKFELDIWYVDNQTFWLDLKIIWMTVCKVLLREGISANGEATMPKFQGSPKS